MTSRPCSRSCRTASIRSGIAGGLAGELANRIGLPAVYPFRDYAEAGGLIAYTVDLGDLFRHAAGQIVKILEGARMDKILPSDHLEAFDKPQDCENTRPYHPALATCSLRRGD